MDDTLTLETVRKAARQMKAMGVAPCVDASGREYYLMPRGDMDKHALDGLLEVIEMPYQEWEDGDYIVTQGFKGQGFVIPADQGG